MGEDMVVPLVADYSHMEVDLNELVLDIREGSNKDLHMTIGQKTKHHNLVVDGEWVSFNCGAA